MSRDLTIQDMAGQGGSITPPARRRWLLVLLLAAGAALLGGYGLLAAAGMVTHLNGVDVLLLLMVAVLLGLLAHGVASGQIRFRGADEAETLASAWDAFPAACLITRANGRPLHANAAWWELLARMKRRRLCGPEILFAGDAEVSRRLFALHQQLRVGRGGEVEVPLSLPGAAQGERRLRIQAMPFMCDGKPAHLWMLEDITEWRARAGDHEQSLAETLQELARLPVGVMLTDAEGRLRYANERLRRWLKLRGQSGAGMALQAVLPGELATRLLALKDAGDARRLDQPAMLPAGDGQGGSLPVRVIAEWMEGRGLSILFLEERPRGAREQVLEQVERFLAESPVGVALVDEEGRISFANAALLRSVPHLKPGDAAGNLVPEGDRRKLLAAIDAVREHRRDAVELDVYVSDAGDTRAQITVAPAPGGQVVLHVIDTTLKQNLMQQLEHGQMMQQIGQMASQLAHDFNNILTGVLGSADMLLQRMQATDPNYREVYNIKSRAWDAAKIVEQLLAFSRQETLQPKVISVNDWLMRESKLFRSFLKKVELKAEYAPDLWPVKVDPAKLGRTVLNLVRNAQDAMPEGGRITIRTRNVPQAELKDEMARVMAVDDYVLIEVEDTGEGIPEDIREKIFEPFFTTKPMTKGTGLGLSTVHGFVKQSGGYIFCDSEVGRGTTFRIYLPRHIETEEERAERLAREMAAKTPPRQDLTGSGVILLAEDEDPVRDIAVRALRMRGYTVLEAASAELAIDLMEERLAEGKDIDLIVSDVVMPGMDGPSMVKELRRMGVMAPVVFMSGHAEEAFAKSLDKDMEFIFLSKPFDLRTIAETVKEAFETVVAARRGKDADLNQK